MSKRKRPAEDVSRHEHEAMMADYTTWSSSGAVLVTEEEAALRSQHQFLRDDEADAVAGATDWRVRMAVRYYQKLFKEYALGDFSRYTEGKVGLRWRTEAEVVRGKGQFICGNKRCDATDELKSYEVLFAYVEQGAKKECLVKLRVCPPCAAQLFYKKTAKKAAKKAKKHKAAQD
ncbi:hypothetical protein SDRG_11047 [Saprolegnia diclina VS20]|uniref:Protein FRA10AC1 n=1 Tax=Saprolegnia diclina (strain VS20) TaxID=1156394 RepID=T0RGQ2_SAPDV|nr:hypothetical protein SDRG_11047 [Saprolegnia diclina VS20]EQC31448.1 hypothetical protein SDRG_11047 [Saprolegnia diclina VS20]|eukprot:XP_008615289.1 hypothetical protein SDRG_11047 [Saprolegnia diclina VS20]